MFLAIIFGLVFGSQAYSALKFLIFPEYFRGFYGLKFGLWLMCTLFDGYVINKFWWLVFVIGTIHLIIFVSFINHTNRYDYLSTPLHPDGKRKEK